jgi:lipid II:glycine glycyltransferase (peptidoglycan interpeptide bridge formation enzyme)
VIATASTAGAVGGPSVPAAKVSSPEGEAWDRDLIAANGHLLQSWRWGRFKEMHGWHPERIRVEAHGRVAFAQILFRTRGPFGLGYVARGPSLDAPDPELARRLFAAVDETCRRRGAISVVVEPDKPLPFRGRVRREGFVRGPAHIQPGRTVKVPLLDDEPLLNQMHQKTRYNIRLAQRRGVTAVRSAPTPDALSTFYGLLADTAHRNEFGIHGADYYGDFMRVFGEDAVLLFALIDGEPVAGVIAACFGDEGIYMYGASSTRHRAHGAGFYLQFEAMRWARQRGCRRYDLWGIPEQDPPSIEVDGGHRVAGTRADDWRGLYEFKVRFGGEIVTFPPVLERRYRPVLATLARRLVGTGG